MAELFNDLGRLFLWKCYGFIVSFKRIIRRNKQLKNKYAGVKRCFIIATGPSINTVDLTKLQGEFIISVSNFFVHKDFQRLHPKYHIFAKSHKPITFEQFSAWLSDADKYFTDPELAVVLSEYDNNIVKAAALFKEHETYYYTYGGSFPVNFSKPLPPMKTVVHLAIYLAIYMGIKEIYLLGVDHDWVLNYGKSRHFYKENEHAMNRNSYDEWSYTEDIGVEFRNLAKLWDTYRMIRRECNRRGIKIYNSTPGSLLDIFPFRLIYEIFKE